jgi:hypothetical protein
MTEQLHSCSMVIRAHNGPPPAARARPSRCGKHNWVMLIEKTIHYLAGELLEFVETVGLDLRRAPHPRMATRVS